ncbi:MAG: DUF6768 family protein [Litorimonas sp.]
MTDFDTEMKALLSEQDADYIADAIDETGYYKTMFGSLRGKGSGLRVASWGAITVMVTILFVSLWQMFVAETVRVQILWATFAILANSGQIAFKLWFNMQLNRRALSHEIRRLQLAVMAKS